MDRYRLVASLLMVPSALGAPALSYKGGIRLPMALATTDGVRLAKGQYDVEVKVEHGGYNLVFLQNEHALATVKGEALKDDASDPPVTMPLIGTQYLRSSADPVGTEAERHSSKTGLAQYEEENRDWKAAIRVYKSPDDKRAVFLFNERRAGEQWNRVVFKLLLEASE
jgi:hypothetical protein